MKLKDVLKGQNFTAKILIFTFNVNKCKIIDYIKILENESYNINPYTELSIIITNKYIIASNNNDKIYIIYISDQRKFK